MNKEEAVKYLREVHSETSSDSYEWEEGFLHGLHEARDISDKELNSAMYEIKRR